MFRSLRLWAAMLIAGVGLALASAAPSAAAMPTLAGASQAVTSATPVVEKVHMKRRWWRHQRRAYFRKRHVPYYVYQPYYYNPYYYSYSPYYVFHPYKRRHRFHHSGVHFGIVIGF